MSFDIGLIVCNEADRVDQHVNPFTGGVTETLGGSVTGEQREAIDKMLDSVHAMPVEEGTFAVTFIDDGALTIHFIGYNDNEIRGGEITVDQVSPDLSSFIHSLLRNASLALLPIENDASPIAPSKQIAQDFANRWPNITVAESDSELQDLLTIFSAKPEHVKTPWWRFW